MAIEDQAREVSRVKKYKAGFILDPVPQQQEEVFEGLAGAGCFFFAAQVCVLPTMTLEELDVLKTKHGISATYVCNFISLSCNGWVS